MCVNCWSTSYWTCNILILRQRCTVLIDICSTRTDKEPLCVFNGTGDVITILAARLVHSSSTNYYVGRVGISRTSGSMLLCQLFMNHLYLVKQQAASILISIQFLWSFLSLHSVYFESCFKNLESMLFMYLICYSSSRAEDIRRSHSLRTVDLIPLLLLWSLIYNYYTGTMAILSRARLIAFIEVRLSAKSNHILICSDSNSDSTKERPFTHV